MPSACTAIRTDTKPRTSGHGHGRTKARSRDWNASSSGSKQPRSEINLVAKTHREVLSLAGSTTDEILYSAEEAHTWLVDSGVTFHVTPHHQWFTDYSGSAGLLCLGNVEECQIFRVGTIPLWLPNGNEIILQQVRHVPNLKRNLISISILGDHRYITTLNDSMWKISKGNMQCGHGVKYNNVYPLMVIGQEESLNVAEMPSSRLWHERLVHMSQTGLWRLTALGYIPDLQHTESGFFEYFQYGK